MLGLFKKKKTWTVPGGRYDMLAHKVLEAEHALIAGTTGCGKTTFLRAVMQSLLVQESPATARLILIDPKQFEIMEYEHLPHVLKYTDTIKGAVEALKYAADLMDSRAKAMKQARTKVCNRPDVYVIIDELHDLLISDRAREIKFYMQRIITMGRALKVHLISCTQNPNRSTIPANIVSCYTCRIGMHCADAIESRQIVGTKGCEDLPKHGEIIGIIEGERMQLKTPYVTEAEINPLIAYWMKQA